ncbi:AbrB family transcriptional regulator [Lactobacillus sp. PSON]|uniref:AbrB family transcriptional regulator n=1 Tax=Lactobacillus sp. PSON TaxID=3455454 RepID=UPI0040412175
MAENTLEKTKMFKAGNSYALRLTKEDRKLLHADNNTIFEKKVSADGNTITFSKLEAVHPELDNFINDFYAKNSDLMRDLETK